MPQAPLLQQQRFAARKGTRDRKTKRVVKQEVKKEEFVPYKVKMAKLNVATGPRRLTETGKPEAIDDVYKMRHFKTQPITLLDAIQFHRETNHPSVYNCPDLFLIARMELDMSLDKKNRYLDNFTRILVLPHNFDLQPVRKVLALCQTEEGQKAATEAGAELVGGLDLVKKIQTGAVSLNEYDHIVAHTNMVNDIVSVRGLMKRRFPSVKQGSMGIDMAQMVQRFSTGIEFSSKKDPHELDFGVVEIAFGKLTMSTAELEANFSAILKDIESCRGRSSGNFIVHCYVTAPPSKEKFLTQHQKYVGVPKKIKPSNRSLDAAKADRGENDVDKDDTVIENEDETRRKATA